MWVTRLESTHQQLAHPDSIGQRGGSEGGGNGKAAVGSEGEGGPG